MNKQKLLINNNNLNNSNNFLKKENVNIDITQYFDLKIEESKYLPFYKIKYPNSNKISYILLTKHVISSKEFSIPEIVLEKLKECKGIAFESNPYNNTSKLHHKAIEVAYEKIKIKRKEMLLLLNKISKIKNDKLNKDSALKLFDHYDKMFKLSKKMLKLRKEMGGSKDHLMISIAHLAYGLLYPNTCLFMENELLNIANQTNKKITSLDEDIIIKKKNDKGLIEKAADLAIEIINNLAIPELFEFHSSIEKGMSNEYINGDSKGFQKRKKMDIYKKNVIKRNIKWLPKIKENPGYLFTTGADHFPGKDGIKKLLENEGFSILQMI